MFEKIFDTIDKVFKVVVATLFVAMVFGFASCSDNDEDENDCKRNHWEGDSELAEAYAILIANGYNVENAWIRGNGGSYLQDIPAEEEAKGQFNVIVDGFNLYLTEKGINPTEYLTTLIQSYKCLQEQTFGVQMFDSFFWKTNENYINIYFKNYCGKIVYDENSFKLMEMVEVAK